MIKSMFKSGEKRILQPISTNKSLDHYHKQVDYVQNSNFLAKRMKALLLSSKRVRQWWTTKRSKELAKAYSRRREYYHQQAAAKGVVYNEYATILAIRERIRARGYNVEERKIGDIHTFACIPLYGWHSHLLTDLYELGNVSHFDYTKHGITYESLAQGTTSSERIRDSMSELILRQFREANKRQPIDWLFCYGGGQDTPADALKAITREYGTPIVNLALDDKQGWAGKTVGGFRTGTVDITKFIDLYITSARVACEWHMLEDGRAIYMPEGFDATTHRPIPTAKDIEVSFVGGAYGFRRSVIDYLRESGVNILTFGDGWKTNRISTEQQVLVFNRSIINLGMGGIEYSEQLTNVKARDFEIPGCGGGVYLTSFNPDLAQHFEIGKEILCYRNRDEMLEMIRFYLRNQEEANAIACRARERCLKEHRWLHRYMNALRILEILKD